MIIKINVNKQIDKNTWLEKVRLIDLIRDLFYIVFSVISNVFYTIAYFNSLSESFFFFLN